MNDENRALEEGPAWNAINHIWAAMAEALAAERIHGASDVPGDADWIGGNNPGTDITGVIGGSRVHEAREGTLGCS